LNSKKARQSVVLFCYFCNMILDYIKYLIQAKDEHSLHSPFVFEFYTKVAKTQKHNLENYATIEDLRKQLLDDERIIQIVDFGAGSKLNLSNTRKIKDIAKNSQKSPKLGQFLHRIIAFYNYKNILDLGTSLGLTTAYLSNKNTDNQIHSFEGCPETAKIAQENFDKLSLTHIEIIVGNIDETLPEKSKKISNLDFVFFDANHRYEPTIRYFEQCLTKAHEGSCFVFDDIYWSDEMKQAWQYIKNHSEVTISIDLFWIGIVFFRKKQPKQHYILKF
jgi:predicted O-methyltransferase YrrM